MLQSKHIEHTNLFSEQDCINSLYQPFIRMLLFLKKIKKWDILFVFKIVITSVRGELYPILVSVCKVFLWKQKTV